MPALSFTVVASPIRASELGGTQVRIALKFNYIRSRVEVDSFRGFFLEDLFSGL